jgi:hypothetical protein
MGGAIFLLFLALGQAQPDRPATAEEKKEFLKLLADLPHRGEFFTDEAVTKAVPYTRVLLALTENDLGNRDLYPFLALSAGLVHRENACQYGRVHFSTIAHPALKLFWAVGLLRDNPPSPDVVLFLRKALASKTEAKTLSEMAGPEFEALRERVLRAYERERRNKVELAQRHTVGPFPEYGGGFEYSNNAVVFAPDHVLYAVRPVKQHGELMAYDLPTRSMKSLAIPQPTGFKPKFDFESCFDNPVLSVNGRGDLLCRWTLEGNGDHGLALLKKGSSSFRVRRVAANLGSCRMVAAPGGTSFLIESGPPFTIDQVDEELKLTRVGSFAGHAHHPVDLPDVRLISRDLLHLFWVDARSHEQRLTLRCIDFDVRQQEWLHGREISRVDESASPPREPTVLQLKDNSLHYLWRIDAGEDKTKAAGLYYQAEADGRTVKVCDAEDYRAISVDDRIVVCYTLKTSPEKVFFRVMNHGDLGPPSEITAAAGREHNLSTDYMTLSAASDRIWFVNTLAANALYELRLADAPKR